MNFFALLILIVLSLSVSTCSFTPPLPKQPDESNRMVINKTVPPELEEIP